MASTQDTLDPTDPAGICLVASAETRRILRGDWARRRVRLTDSIEAAIQEVRRSFEATTSMKIGGSAVAIVGGVASVVGFALLVTSFGAALPLAIAGTVAAVGAGVGGGAAAVRHAAVQTKIARRIKKNFEAGRRLMEQLLDQLAATVLTEAKRSLRLHRDLSLGCRICRLLSWLRGELAACRELHARVLREAGMSAAEVAGLPVSECAQRLAALIDATHEFSLHRVSTDFVGAVAPCGQLRGSSRAGRRRRWQVGASQTEVRGLAGRKGQHCVEGLKALEKGPAARERGEEARACLRASEKHASSPGVSAEVQAVCAGLEGRRACEKWLGGAHLCSRGLVGNDESSSQLQPQPITASEDCCVSELETNERELLMDAMTRSAKLVIALLRVSLFGSAEAGNLPNSEAVAGSLKSTLHCNIGLAEGVVQGVGKAGALSAAHILGSAVGSAASTAVDVGLLIYYSKQLHDFKRRGRNPELADQLAAMKLTLQLQLAEVLGLCCTDDGN